MITCIIGTRGRIIIELKKELSVQLNVIKYEHRHINGTEKNNRDTYKEENEDKNENKNERRMKNENEKDLLIIKGSKENVQNAKIKIKELFDSFLSSCETILLSDELVALVVGKRGKILDKGSVDRCIW